MLVYHRSLNIIVLHIFLICNLIAQNAPTPNKTASVEIHTKELSKLMNSDPEKAILYADALVKMYKENNDICQSHIFQSSKLKSMYRIDVKKTLKAIDSLKAIRINCGDKNGIYYGNIFLVNAWIKFDEGLYNAADSLMKIAIEYVKDVNNPKILADVRGNYSTILNAMGKTNSAISLLLQSTNEYDLDKDSTYAVGLYANLCGMYKRLNNYEKAIEFAEKGLTYATNKKDFNLTVLLNNKGSAHLHLDQYEESEASYKLSLKHTLNNNDTYSQSYALHGLSSLMVRKNDYAQAEDYFLQLAKLEKENGYNDNLADTYISLAKLYTTWGKSRKAQEYIANAKVQLDAIDSPKEMMKLNEAEALLKLYLIDSSAYKALSSSIEMREKEVEEFMRSKNQELMEIYKTDQLTKDKESLQSVVSLKAIKLKTQQNIMITIGLFLVVLLILSLILYYFYMKQKDLSIRLNTQKDQIQLLHQELNHRVKNNLYFMTSLLEMQGRRTQNLEAREILQETESRLGALSLVHSNLFKNDEDTTVNLAFYLEELVTQLEKIFAIPGKELNIICNLSDHHVNAEDAMRLGLIVNELVTNSIKHAFTEVNEPQINITTRLDQTGKLALEYKDNGPGSNRYPNFSDNESNSHLGTKLIALLREQMKDRYTLVC